jgi:hypothetical protein
MRHQILDLGCRTAIMPGSLAARAAEASMFADSEVRQVIALWRNPERLAAGASWQPAWPDLIDVLAFGEAGLMAAIRNADGRPAGLIPGPARRTPDKGPLLIEASRTREGTLALRGPMVPRFPFPPGAAPGMRLAVDANGFLDTFYPCRVAGSSGALTVTGPPAGVVSMGGYRFILAGLQEAVSQLEPGAMLAAFPDGLAGQRVAGIAVRRDAIRDALAELGLNPLVINAFRPRRGGETRDAACVEANAVPPASSDGRPDQSEPHHALSLRRPPLDLRLLFKFTAPILWLIPVKSGGPEGGSQARVRS